ncbi:MAG: IncP-type conjugal transfer protein TraG [Gammaproteobacteria bacterium]|nr:IncP-type conjugal transfer protein TraG [Gammaproteobacteria bacterium]MCP4388158.1 IncP-type conjugal transfer protein TraG [Gammaproteobacteria bacterium]MCP5093117.1 IncP-type conjugal transfer protein TraG [Gammaproteobacteria bacterium]
MTRPTYDGKKPLIHEDQRAVLYLNIVGGVLLLLGGLWAATQYAAAALAHQPQLGAPLFSLLDYRVYAPWRVFQWDYYYGTYAPAVFFRAYLWIFGAFFSEVLLMVALAVWRARGQRAGDAYGSARWSEEKELARMGYLDGKGVVLGQTESGKLIQHDGAEHIAGIAQPRSGKGVGWVIPTILCCEHSMIITDIKGENWVRTAGFRSKFSHCLNYNPSAPDSAHFNPLLEIRQGDFEFRDTQSIVDVILDSGDDHQKNDHWQRTGKSLCIALILHVLYAERDKSLTGVINFLSNPERTDEETLLRMMTFNHLGDRPHPIVASLTREVIEKAENELSGVMSTARAFFTLFHDPVIARNTSDSHFRIRDLMHADSPLTLYLTMPGAEVSRTRPLMRILMNQVGRILTETMSEHHDEPDYKHRLLLMLDEFHVLGRMDFFETELAYLPGYGIRAFIVTQSLNQIEKIYGPNNPILDMCKIRVTYGAADERTAERISKMLGESTQTRRMANYAGSRLAPFLMHVMYSEQESPRPLLTLGEVMNIPPDKSVLLTGDVPPHYANRVFFYDDKRFMQRAHHRGHDAPPPTTEAELRAEWPPYTPSPWESSEEKVSHENIAAPGACAAGDLERDEPQAQIEALDSHAALENELAQQGRALAAEERESRAVSGGQKEDEDREQAMQRERERLQRLRQQQSRTTELGREPSGGELPL